MAYCPQIAVHSLVKKQDMLCTNAPCIDKTAVWYLRKLDAALRAGGKPLCAMLWVLASQLTGYLSMFSSMPVRP